MAHDREGRPVKHPGKKAGARISKEERELWEHTARSIEPIKSKKGRVHAALEDLETPPTPPTREPARSAEPSRILKPSPPTSTPLVRITKAPPPPSPLNLERKKTRKVSSGKIEIEGRIDLHGMRQSEAHAALMRFLSRAYASGKRWVLVITGKGAPQRTAYDERSDREGEERGVLRRNVPRWLAEPDVAPIIIGFTAAAIRHGGEGALYVHLRKRPGAPGDD
ncbi:DNA mismatch repair protein MutS [Hyphomicrobium sp. 1Nfss2.1]|uniref:Smr/MutS family protein n=1 Tax=Hyphomicrobium sp. 1Nfss2.1 TaxID=3413936 RepID=UPI003C7A135E